jgi:hypothetical protein
MLRRAEACSAPIAAVQRRYIVSQKPAIRSGASRLRNKAFGGLSNQLWRLMTDEEQVPDPPEVPASSSGGATAAQAGYEYQLNVSVLAALRLLLVTKSATRITLEPANQEDLDADLAPNRPGRVSYAQTLRVATSSSCRSNRAVASPGRSRLSTPC